VGNGTVEWRSRIAFVGMLQYFRFKVSLLLVEIPLPVTGDAAHGASKVHYKIDMPHPAPAAAVVRRTHP
jgi:hypothetical protein